MPFAVHKSDLALKCVSTISDRVTAVDPCLRSDPPDLLVLLGLRHGKVRLQDRHSGLLLRLPSHHDRPSDSDWTHHRMRTQEWRWVSIQGNNSRLSIFLVPGRRLSTGKNKSYISRDCGIVDSWDPTCISPFIHTHGWLPKSLGLQIKGQWDWIFNLNSSIHENHLPFTI